jgi:hypothetical protein
VDTFATRNFGVRRNQPDALEPGVVVHLPPLPPRPTPLLAVVQREALVDVAVDLGELSRRVSPTEVVAPASQNRVELFTSASMGHFRRSRGAVIFLDLGPYPGHRTLPESRARAAAFAQLCRAQPSRSLTGSSFDAAEFMFITAWSFARPG